MSRFTKNSKEEDLQREELMRILHNAELYDYMRLFEQSDSVGDYAFYGLTSTFVMCFSLCVCPVNLVACHLSSIDADT